MIFIFIGPSSSGKDSFYLPILKEFQLQPIVLTTTRPKRAFEEDGITYQFVSQKEMEQLQRDGLLIEKRDYQTVKGLWSYATNSKNIDLGKNYLVINTWEGYQKYLDYYGRDLLVPIYFQVNDGIRLERAVKREQQEDNPDYLEVCRRFLADAKDFDKSYLEKYQPEIIDNNGSFAEALDSLKLIIKKRLK